MYDSFFIIPVFCSFLSSLWITLANICRFLLYKVIWLDLLNEFKVTWHDKVIYKWLFCGWSIPLRKPTENFFVYVEQTNSFGSISGISQPGEDRGSVWW